MKRLSHYEIEDIIGRHPGADVKAARNWLGDLRSTTIVQPLLLTLADDCERNGHNQATVNALLEGHQVAVLG